MKTIHGFFADRGLRLEPGGIKLSRDENYTATLIIILSKQFFHLRFHEKEKNAQVELDVTFFLKSYKNDSKSWLKIVPKVGHKVDFWIVRFSI